MMSYDVDSFNIESNLAISDINLGLVIFFFDVMVSSWTLDRKARSPAAHPQTARCCVGGSAWAAAAWALGRECNEQPLQNCLLTSKELARKTINNSLVNVCWNLPLDADHFIPPWGGWFFNVMNPNYMRRDPYLWNWLVIGWWYFFLIDGMGGKSK